MVQLFNDGSSFRSQLKDRALSIVKHHYHGALTPDIGDCYNQQAYYAAIAHNVEDLLNGHFHRGAPDENVSATTLCPTLIDLCAESHK